MESYQGEIFQIYVVQNKTLKELMQTLKDVHGFDAS